MEGPQASGQPQHAGAGVGGRRIPRVGERRAPALVELFEHAIVLADAYK